MSKLPIPRLPLFLLRFLALFAGGALLVLFWVTLESLFIKRLTFPYLFRFSIPFTVVILAGMIVLLGALVWFRLRRLWPDLSAEGSGRRRGDDELGHSLLRLPSELFWGTIAYGLLFIPVYHVVHFAVEGHSLLRVEDAYRDNFVRSFLYEQAVALSAAILHYAVSRRLTRPLLMRLTNATGDIVRGRSFLSMLAATFIGLMLILMFSILWYVLVARAKNMPVEFHILGPLILLELIFAASIFLLLAKEFRRELLVLIGSIRSLLGGDSSRLYSKMPVLSGDEVGQLAIAFNRLQHRIVKEYEAVAQEIELARQVQLQLLSQQEFAIGDYRARALTEPRRETGSGFYDIVPLQEGGFAVFAGEVSGAGMHAALHMSAALLLLRAEIQPQRSPRDMLDRFRQAQSDMFAEKPALSVALALFDPAADALRFACEGRFRAVLHHPASDAESLHEDADRLLLPGGRLILHSDTALRWLEQGEKSADALAFLDAAKPLPPQLGSGLDRFRAERERAEEDFTLLVVSREERRET